MILGTGLGTMLPGAASAMPAAQCVAASPYFDPDGTTPILNVDDAGQVNEGSVASFRLHLDRAPAQPVTVRACTADGTAISGSDYNDVDTSVTFQPAGWATRRVCGPFGRPPCRTEAYWRAAETVKYVYVSTINDQTLDWNRFEGFQLRVRSVEGGHRARTAGNATIVDGQTPG